MQQKLRKLSLGVSANTSDLNKLDSRVSPQLAKFDKKFNKIDDNFENIVNEIDEKGEETKEAFQNFAELSRIGDQVRTQGLLLDELRNAKNDETRDELELVKQDYIQLKQDVFELQEGEKKLNGGSD